MSIVNIVIDQHRALIGVDTAAGFMAEADQVMSKEARRNRHSCKLSLFPQISAAMTHRGDGFLTYIARLNLDIACPHDFDHAVQLMSDILPRAYTQVTATRKQQLNIESFAGAEVVLVGRSRPEKKFAAFRWRRYPNDSDFIKTRAEKMLLLPEIERAEQVETPDTPAKKESVVRRQMAWVNQNHAGFDCGGKLLMAELRQEEVNVRTIAILN